MTSQSWRSIEIKSLNYEITDFMTVEIDESIMTKSWLSICHKWLISFDFSHNWDVEIEKGLNWEVIQVNYDKSKLNSQLWHQVCHNYSSQLWKVSYDDSQIWQEIDFVCHDCEFHNFYFSSSLIEIVFFVMWWKWASSALPHRHPLWSKWLVKEQYITVESNQD